MTPTGIEPATFRFVAQHHCATAVRNRIEYREYFLGVKIITLPPAWAFVMYSRKLNFLEPSGHLGPVMGLIYPSFMILEIGSSDVPPPGAPP